MLGCGAEEKNTFCLTKDNYAFLSQHIGDMQNMETLEHFDSSISLYKRLFQIEANARKLQEAKMNVSERASRARISTSGPILCTYPLKAAFDKGFALCALVLFALLMALIMLEGDGEKEKILRFGSWKEIEGLR